MTPQEVARMLIEGDAIRLASLPIRIFDEALAAGLEPRVVEGMRQAQQALANHLRETDAEEIFQQIKREVKEGLTELERRSNA